MDHWIPIINDEAVEGVQYLRNTAADGVPIHCHDCGQRCLMPVHHAEFTNAQPKYLVAVGECPRCGMPRRIFQRSIFFAYPLSDDS